MRRRCWSAAARRFNREAGLRAGRPDADALSVSKTVAAELRHAGAAWRDGAHLVVSRHEPLPELCVLCGAWATHEQDAKLLANVWSRPSSWLKLGDVRFPLCERHFTARRRWVKTSVALGIAFYVVVAASLLAVFGFSRNTLLLLVPVIALVALTLHGDRSRRHHLRIVRLDADYAWLSGAGEGLLAQLPELPDALSARRREGRHVYR
jgi:hypothetical protein